MRSLRSDALDTGQEDVLRAAVIDRGPDTMTVFLEVRRTKFVTVVYDTEHVVRFRWYGPSRATSRKHRDPDRRARGRRNAAAA